ncbi:asparagine-linked glycosylation protein [Phlyctochytrium planicorne]|nr:asparagine-linked glycosylation protein [Phlyctochytrium planicorne]
MHQIQIQAFSHFWSRTKEFKTAKLVLIGGARNHDDFQRIADLRNLAKDLSIFDQVHFSVNAPYHVLLDYLSRATIGMNTMINEHFGIGIVEYMAAGIVSLAHNSGGPKSDIIQDEVTGRTR